MVRGNINESFLHDMNNLNEPHLNTEAFAVLMNSNVNTNYECELGSFKTFYLVNDYVLLKTMIRHINSFYLRHVVLMKFTIAIVAKGNENFFGNQDKDDVLKHSLTDKKKAYNSSN